MITITTVPSVADWVAKRLGMPDRTAFKEHTVIGVAIDGKPAMGVVYSQFRRNPHGNDVFVNIAAATGKPWAKPAVLRAIFGYPFEQLGCERLTAVIREGNEKSVAFVKRLGFRKEGVIRRGWDGKTNALVFGMLKSECRYLNG